MYKILGNDAWLGRFIRYEIDPDIGSNAADAMSIVKKDFRSFLVDSLEL